MRRLIVQLLRHEFHWCEIHEVSVEPADGGDEKESGNIEVLLIDEVDLCREVDRDGTDHRVIVIAPEADPAYDKAAAAAGAVGCLARDRIAEDLAEILRGILGGPRA